MTLTDILSAIGIVATGIGSTIAMIGVYKQMNGYFAFRLRDIFKELWMLGTALCNGLEEFRKQTLISATLGKKRGEDVGSALVGFYFVLFGFAFQMIGTVFLFIALFFNETHAAGATKRIGGQ